MHGMESLDLFQDVGKLKHALERTLVSCAPDARLQLLLRADRDAEEMLLQALRSRLLDLYESLSWAYATAAEVEKKRQFLLAACEEQMLLLKRDFLPSLAREHGLQEQYIHGCKEPAQRTALGFESLADLEFALMLWRQNLKRDLACTDAKEEKERQVRAAYIEAEALVKRCLNASHRTWNDLARQQLRTRRPGSGFSAGPPRRMSLSAHRQMSLSDAPLGGESVITVYERAMAQVWLRLEAIAQQHGVAEALQVFVRMERASSHPMSFTEVAAAIQEVSNALEGGASPAAAEAKVQEVARVLSVSLGERSPDEDDSSVSIG